MKTYWVFILLLLAGCNGVQQNTTTDTAICNCDSSANNVSAAAPYYSVRGALLGSRFKSLGELKSVVTIEYFNENAESDSTIHNDSKVVLRHCSNGRKVESVLAAGVSQGNITAAKNGDFRDRLGIIFRSPYAVRNRKDLEKVYLLARMRPYIFGEGDVAFFNLAQASFHNINITDSAFANPRDTTEKGYINTFNHMTAQAFITSCFSEELADFVGDAHERYYHPELIVGKFREKEIDDLAEGPVDNYVDIINNEWGQEVGKQLRKKYKISRKTCWTPELLADYLNDLQDYYSWAFRVGFKPFRAEDEKVIKFSRKLNVVMNGKSFENY